MTFYILVTNKFLIITIQFDLILIISSEGWIVEVWIVLGLNCLSLDCRGWIGVLRFFIRDQMWGNIFVTRNFVGDIISRDIFSAILWRATPGRIFSILRSIFFGISNQIPLRAMNVVVRRGLISQKLILSHSTYILFVSDFKTNYFGELQKLKELLTIKHHSVFYWSLIMIHLKQILVCTMDLKMTFSRISFIFFNFIKSIFWMNFKYFIISNNMKRHKIISIIKIEIQLKHNRNKNFHWRRKRNTIEIVILKATQH